MFSQLLTASNLVRATADDLPSQINHVWTVSALTAMGLLISLVQYAGDPIHCWCPAHMPEVHCNYTRAMCWIKETYYVDLSQPIPSSPAQRTKNEINYYPWAPWILFSMAVMFKIPNILWTGFSPMCDLNLERFVEDAEWDVSPGQLASIVRIWLFQSRYKTHDRLHGLKKTLGSLGLFWLGRHRRTFLTGLMMFTKLCYLLVAIGMFWSLNIFIDGDFTSYGWDALLDFMNGISHDSVRFPKHTTCDILIRQMNNVNTYTIQCILPINMYNQKIFLVLWFWYVIMTIVNAYSVMHWAFNLLSPSRRWKLVNDYVIIMNHVQKNKQILGIIDSTPDGSTSSSTSGEQGNRETNVFSPNEDERSNNIINNNNSSNESIGGNAIDDVISDDSSSLVTVGINTDGTRLRVGKHVNFMKNDTPCGPSRKRKKKIKRYFQISPIEVDLQEFDEKREKLHILRKTAWIYSKLDCDGVLLFRTLETAVGVVLSNDIFSELFQQLVEAEHHSAT